MKSAKKALVVISGGLDSTTALLYATQNYESVEAVSFFYGQKQYHEIELARMSCKRLLVPHRHIDISFIADIAKGVSANLSGSEIKMPTIKDVLGDPQPVTYVPNRNMMMLAISASVAESVGATDLLMGFQSNDEYGYWDTTQAFVDAMNAALSLNRGNAVKLVSPFVDWTKAMEIQYTLDVTGNIDLYTTTITCYEPRLVKGVHHSCGRCPSCAERLKAFKSLGLVDPIPYVSELKDQ